MSRGRINCHDWELLQNKHCNLPDESCSNGLSTAVALWMALQRTGNGKNWSKLQRNELWIFYASSISYQFFWLLNNLTKPFSSKSISRLVFTQQILFYISRAIDKGGIVSKFHISTRVLVPVFVCNWLFEFKKLAPISHQKFFFYLQCFYL